MSSGQHQVIPSVQLARAMVLAPLTYERWHEVVSLLLKQCPTRVWTTAIIKAECARVLGYGGDFETTETGTITGTNVPTGLRWEVTCGGTVHIYRLTHAQWVSVEPDVDAWRIAVAQALELQ